MAHTFAFLSLPTEFPVCSAVDFVCSPVVPDRASQYHSRTIPLTLLFPPTFTLEPLPPNASNAWKASYSQGVSYDLFLLQKLSTKDANFGQR